MESLLFDDSMVALTSGDSMAQATERRRKGMKCSEGGMSGEEVLKSRKGPVHARFWSPERPDGAVVVRRPSDGPLRSRRDSGGIGGELRCDRSLAPRSGAVTPGSVVDHGRALFRVNSTTLPLATGVSGRQPLP